MNKMKWSVLRMTFFASAYIIPCVNTTAATFIIAFRPYASAREDVDIIMIHILD